jgi:hypothetical protein
MKPDDDTTLKIRFRLVRISLGFPVEQSGIC